jgi:hypothetical protein
MLDGVAEAIKKLSPMSDAEALEAASNLVGFFEVLIEIDREQNPIPQLGPQVCG